MHNCASREAQLCCFTFGGEHVKAQKAHAPEKTNNEILEKQKSDKQKRKINRSDEVNGRRVICASTGARHMARRSAPALTRPAR